MVEQSLDLSPKVRLGIRVPPVNGQFLRIERSAWASRNEVLLPEVSLKAYFLIDNCHMQNLSGFSGTRAV